MARLPHPQRATIRPRILVDGATPMLLEDAVARLLAAPGEADIALVGRNGSGKTTALRHLAATFGNRSDLRLVDESDSAPMQRARVTIRATRGRPDAADAQTFVLAPWSDEDCDLYLAMNHPQQRGPALAAWMLPAPTLDLRQRPDLVAATLDHIATVARVDPNMQLPDAFCALAFVLATRLGQRRAAARAFSLRSLGAASSRSQEATEALLTPSDRQLLDCACVRTMLAAEDLVRAALQRSDAPTPPRQWPQQLVDAIAHLLLIDPVLVHELGTLAMDPPRRPALLLSILAAAEPSFRPPVGRYRDLAGARLRGIDMRGANLAGANLQRVDFTGARLCDADLTGADLTGARLCGSDLSRASMTRCKLEGAEFEGAELREAVMDPGALPTQPSQRRGLGQSAG